MRGKHTIKVRNRRIQFEIELERNITIIRGDSATGKTTLIGMLRDYEALGESSGVTITCDKPCRVLTSVDWQERLSAIQDSIVFVDEGNTFVCSRDFAEAIDGTSNYYVLITRESLYQLPYSVDAVLELRKTTVRSSGNTKCTYNKAYPYYKSVSKITEHLSSFDRIITEDANSGHQMFEHIASRYGTMCVAAEGKSNIFRILAERDYDRILVIADGAAFGAEMEKVYQFQNQHPGHVTLYLPECFEWLILKSGIIRSDEIGEVLAQPSDYIEAAEYFSWERYFTQLLIELTRDSHYMSYNKSRLADFYLQNDNVQKVLEAVETE